MSELVERTPEQEAALERAMAGMDAQADIWAEEVNLVGMIKNVAQVARIKPHVPDDVREGFIGRMEAQIDAIARQSFLEGWIRGGMSRQDYDAATTTRLQEALAAAEAERDQVKRLFETNIDRAENQWKAWEARAREAEALLAETRKKALEEASQIAEDLAASSGDACGSRDVDHIMQCAAREDMGHEVAAAIRSLSNVEASK